MRRQGFNAASQVVKPFQTGAIVVPLDGSVHAAAALPVARVLAELEGVPLHVLHVAPEKLAPGELLQRLQLSQAQLPGTIIDSLRGPPAEVIVAQANQRHARFIVMCARGRPVDTAGEVGRVAREVLQSAPCPVVMVQPQAEPRPWALHRIVLPHDGRPASAASFKWAADLAHKTGAEVVVLHVAGPRQSAAETGTFASPRYVDQSHHEWPVWTREFLGRLTGLSQPTERLHLRMALVTGEAAPAITQYAAEHAGDLVVLAWHGNLESERALTVRALIGDSPCPVLVIRIPSRRGPPSAIRMKTLGAAAPTARPGTTDQPRISSEAP